MSKKKQKNIPQRPRNLTKFELRLNGEFLCRAVTSGVKRSLRAGISYSSQDQTSVLEVIEGLKPVWLRAVLKVGDEVSIRLVDEGEPTDAVGDFVRPLKDECNRIVKFRR